MRIGYGTQMTAIVVGLLVNINTNFRLWFLAALTEAIPLPTCSTIMVIKLDIYIKIEATIVSSVIKPVHTVN